MRQAVEKDPIIIMTTDIQAVIRQMTLEEKAALCTGASTWTTTPLERLGIPEMIVSGMAAGAIKG